jgi:hypothetical protein
MLAFLLGDMDSPAELIVGYLCDTLSKRDIQAGLLLLVIPCSKTGGWAVIESIIRHLLFKPTLAARDILQALAKIPATEKKEKAIPAAKFYIPATLRLRWANFRLPTATARLPQAYTGSGSGPASGGDGGPKVDR